MFTTAGMMQSEFLMSTSVSSKSKNAEDVPLQKTNDEPIDL